MGCDPVLTYYILCPAPLPRLPCFSTHCDHLPILYTLYCTYARSTYSTEQCVLQELSNFQYSVLPWRLSPPGLSIGCAYKFVHDTSTSGLRCQIKRENIDDITLPMDPLTRHLLKTCCFACLSMPRRGRRGTEGDQSVIEMSVDAQQKKWMYCVLESHCH